MWLTDLTQKCSSHNFLWIFLAKHPFLHVLNMSLQISVLFWHVNEWNCSSKTESFVCPSSLLARRTSVSVYPVHPQMRPCYLSVLISSNTVNWTLQMSINTLGILGILSLSSGLRMWRWLWMLTQFPVNSKYILETFIRSRQVFTGIRELAGSLGLSCFF